MPLKEEAKFPDRCRWQFRTRMARVAMEAPPPVRLVYRCLGESPSLRRWLEQHGFSSEQLIQYLRWNPAEQMRQIRTMDPERRARHATQLHRENRRNLRRMEDNLAKALLVRPPSPPPQRDADWLSRWAWWGV